MPDPKLPSTAVPAPACRPKAAIPANRFENPTAFQKAVGIGFDNLKIDHECETSAQQIQAQTDSTTNRQLKDATSARDAKNAEARMPVVRAQQALSDKQAELRAPITDLTGKLEAASAVLDRTTFPNKRELNGRRAEANQRAETMQNVLNAARATLASFDGRTRELNQRIENLRDKQAVNANELSSLDSQVRYALQALRTAEANAPTDRELQSASDSRASAQARYDEAVAALNAGDRPTPPSAGDRPTPPSPNGRPTPPSPDRPTPPSAGGRPTPPSIGSDRPKPPSVGGDRPTPPSPNDRPTPPSVGGDRPTPPRPDGPSRSELEARVSAARTRLAEARDRSARLDARLDDVAEKTRHHQALARRADAVRVLAASTGVDIDNTAEQLRQRAGQRPGLVEQVRTGEQMAAVSRQEAARLEATPYDRGDAAAIAAEQAKVDGLNKDLARAKANFTTGVKPFEEQLAALQQTYDATMAPFEQAVRGATGTRQAQLQQATSQTRAAAERLAQSKKDLESLKEDSPGIKWSAPKWLGGWGFSTKDFWKQQPEIK